MSERTPTPTGWSDTDWIKKLQHEEENPLGCLHINQGSFDAAADAYEAEYKMHKCTAMEIERLLAINAALTAKSNAFVVENARQAEKIERLTAERETIISDFLKRTGQYVTNDASREAAIAAAVLAEREAISAKLRELADELGHGLSWWGTPSGLLYRAAEMVSDRTKP